VLRVKIDILGIILWLEAQRANVKIVNFCENCNRISAKTTLARLALADLDWFIETLTTIIFMHLLLLEFEEE
jgi:hypothetical protein